MAKRSSPDATPAPDSKAEGSSSGFLGDVYGVLRKNALGVLAGSLGTIATSTGVLLSPLKVPILHLVFPEKAQVVVLPSATTPREREGISIQALISPQSISPVEGWLTFEFDSGQLRPESSAAGQPTFTFSGITGPTKLPETPIRLITLRPGKAQVRVSVHTRYGLYSGVTTVDVQAAAPDNTPSPDNPSGGWTITLGDRNGHMNVVVRGTQVAGEYSLEGFRGAVDGTLDGTQFNARLFRGDSPLRWFVRGQWDGEAKVKGFLQITGKARLQRANAAGWADEGQAPEEFSAIADLFSSTPKR